MAKRRQSVQFTLRFPIADIRDIAERYSYEDDRPVVSMGTTIRKRGWAHLSELTEIVRWKSRRSLGHFSSNSEVDANEATRVSLSSPSEAVRIGVLQSLHGVGLPIASAILHLCHADPYPLLDWRTFWSLGVDPMPTPSLALWLEYVAACRRLAEEVRVDMRTLDRALWQFPDEAKTKKR